MSDMNDEVYDLSDASDDRPGMEDVEDFGEDLADFDDDLDDAALDEIDFVIALWREEGIPQAIALEKNLANDFEDLLKALRRIPGDAGALGMVSIGGEFFVMARVRGSDVQVILSDSTAAWDYPIARDVVDFLDEDIDDGDDEAAPVGDFEMLQDLGIDDFELEQLAGNYDDNSDDIVQQIADKLGLGEVFSQVAD
ncbi:MAG: tRNA adenosine deaminase-associated protein [Propionibacteriaceae bacterium]